jgi:Zn-dependent protease
VAGVVFIALLFVCVLLHEFGHIFAARRYGVQTPDVILLPIGGVARLERIPEEPAQEIVVALAGPAVNLVIAGVLYLALGGLVPREGLEMDNPGVGLLARLLWANLFLAVVNLIPAFPMDGGRVLRAFLAHRLGYARGTQIAASVGQGAASSLGDYCPTPAGEDSVIGFFRVDAPASWAAPGRIAGRAHAAWLRSWAPPSGNRA